MAEWIAHAVSRADSHHSAPAKRPMGVYQPALPNSDLYRNTPDVSMLASHIYTFNDVCKLNKICE